MELNTSKCITLKNSIFLDNNTFPCVTVSKNVEDTLIYNIYIYIFSILHYFLFPSCFHVKNQNAEQCGICILNIKCIQINSNFFLSKLYNKANVNSCMF